MSEPPPLDAATLVGLLADDDRRRVVAALVLGASDAEQVAAAALLDAPRTWKAIGRLVDAGLVEHGADGTLVLLGAAFQQAARHAASARAEVAGAPVDAPPEVAKVLRAFVRDGRLLSIPTARAKRLIVLDVIAQDFEPGRHYSERQVNLILGRWHADVASLRRYLVDEGFVDRDHGQYWRTGGTVPDPPAN